MAARTTNRFKQKPAVPFGDFMLPILGIIALGIVVIGLKILWKPSSPKSNLIAQPKASTPSVTITQRSNNNEHVIVQGITKQQEIGDIVVAQPVAQAGEDSARSAPDATATENKTSAAASKTPAKKQPPQPAPKTASPAKNAVTATASPEPKKTPAPKQTAVNAGSIDKSQFIVQCGSYSELTSANSVVASLKKIGLMAVVRKAEVRGKTYFRVIVAGGNDRAVAEEVAKKVQEAGFPILVRAND